jgi:hypothetical protein
VPWESAYSYVQAVRVNNSIFVSGQPFFAIDVPAAFAASGRVRPAVYGQPVPQVASNLIGVSALAFPEQLIEIAFRAEVQS